ncbi:MAG: DedA family protein [Candidatus Gracilibacteria bacterium]|nr:DedA family protein [Candidatus Gracilibacteria bacterium]
MIKKIIKIITNLLNILFIILTFGLIFVSIFKKEWIEIAIEWLKIVINGLGNWNYIIGLISSCIEAFPILGGLLPGTNVLLLVGGFFGNLSKENLVFLIVIASIGAIIGNYVGFALGKKYGERFFNKYGLYIGIGKTEVKYLKSGIEKWGAWGIILGKFHATTRTFLPFIAGTTGMKSGKFMLYNTIGSIIRATLVVVLGVLFVAYYKIILNYSGMIFLGILVIIGIYIYKFKSKEFKKYWDEKNLEIEEMSKK